jgi:hypothetical protein
MDCNLRHLIWVVFLLGSVTSISIAQKSGQAAGQGGQQGGQGNQGSVGSAGLQGLSYSPDEWPNLRLPDVKGSNFTFTNGRRVVCYRLVKGNSGTQPFVLEPISKGEVSGSGFYRPCGDESQGETDTQGQKSCKQRAISAAKEAKAPNRNTRTKLATDPTHWSACSELEDTKEPLLMNQLLVLGIDVSDLGAMGVNVNQLKLLNINVTNQQAAALNPSPIRPSFPATSAAGGGGGSAGWLGAPEDTSGKGNFWIPIGTHARAGEYPQKWEEDHPGGYKSGDVVTDASGAHFFMANHNFAKPGKKPTDPFPPEPRVERIADGSVIWQEVNDPGDGIARPPSSWVPYFDYAKDDLVCVLRRKNDATIGIQLLKETYRIQMSQVLSGTDTVASLSFASGPFPSPSQATGSTPLTAAPQKQRACGDLRNNLREGDHLHYYYAIKGGTSGTPPPDPLSVSMIPRAIYLTWPYELPGDVIPTFNVNLVYSPPVPGAPWQGNTFYPSGSVVTSSRNESSASPTTGHYYTALTGGFSSPEPDEPTFPGDVPPTADDGTLVWLDAGTAAPNTSATLGAGSTQSGGASGGQGGAGGPGGGGGGGGGGTSKAQFWFPKTRYLLGDVILNPDNGHYYTVMNLTGGFSGQLPSNQQASGKTPQTDPFPPTPAQTEILTDGQVQWMEVAAPAVTQPKWQPGSPYKVGDVVLAADHQNYVMTASTAITGGMSGAGPASPFPLPPSANVRQVDGTIIWMFTLNGTAGQDWLPNTPYSVGNVVFDGHNNKYVVVGMTQGKSGATDPTFLAGSAPLVTVTDGDLVWGDLGPSATPAQYQKWLSNHNYTIGQSVSGSNGHDYSVVRFISGTSGPAPQSPFPTSTPANPSPTRVADGTIVWARDSSPPNGVWDQNTHFDKDSVVYPPEDVSQTHRWKALNGGTSGPVPVRPAFPVLEANIVVEPKSDPIEENPPGNIVWADQGVIRPFNLPAGNERAWAPSLPARNPVQFKVGDVVFVKTPGGGRYYRALQSGNTGATSPFVNLSLSFPLTWQDSGTTAPASVSSGQPADQTVSLINLTLPQSHSLNYFNIAAGVAVGVKRSRTFGFVPASSYTGKLPTGYTAATGTVSLTPTSSVAADPVTGCTITVPYTAPPTMANPDLAYACPEQTSTGAIPVDPVLVLTGYIVPVDTERPMRFRGSGAWRDYLPAPSFGISLSNPTTNFYIGASNEALLRNLEIFYGASFHNTPLKLAPGTAQPLWGGVGAAPTAATVPGFLKGPFVGVTFNLSGFIQSLFGGGGGGGAKGQ